MIRSRALVVMAAAIAWVVTGCTMQPDAGSDPTPAGTSGGMHGAAASGPLEPVGSTAPDAYAVRPVPAEQIDRAIAALPAMVQDTMERSGLPGMAVAVVRGGQTVYAEGFGVREVGKPERVDADTVFQIASVSKSIGSTCVSAAVSKGRLTWSDPVTDYLPDFRLADPDTTKQVTVADFFAHRSGLPSAAGDDLEGLGFDRDYILSHLDEFDLNPFRISYGYANFGLTTGAEAAARAAGEPWEKLCADELYTPLGMTSTSSRHADFTARSNRATIHFRTGDKSFEPRYVRDADAQSPAGGVSSTVTDLSRWMIMNLQEGRVDGKQLIKPEVLLESRTPQVLQPARNPLPTSRRDSYGYGFNVVTTSTGHVKLSHSGAFYVGAGTAYALIPAADVGIVVLTNGSPVGAAETLTTGFTDLVRSGAVERDWLDYYGGLFDSLFVNQSTVAEPAPPTAKKPRSLDAYVGTYRNRYVGDVVVGRDGDRLRITLGPKKLSAPLTPYDGDTFSWLAPGGNGDPVSAATFSGGSAAAERLDLELLQIPTLRRVS